VGLSRMILDSSRLRGYRLIVEQDPTGGLAVGNILICNVALLCRWTVVMRTMSQIDKLWRTSVGEKRGFYLAWIV